MNKVFDNKLKKRLKETGRTQNDLCKEIEMTPQGLRKSIDNKTLPLGKLEVISTVLHVPMSYWFLSEKAVDIDIDFVFEQLKLIVKERITL